MQCVSLFLGRVRGEGVRGFGGSRVQVCGTRDALEVALGERLLGVTCPDTINLTVDPPLPAPAGDMEYACPMKRLDTAGLKERGDGAVPNGQDASCWTELLTHHIVGRLQFGEAGGFLPPTSPSTSGRGAGAGVKLGV